MDGYGRSERTSPVSKTSHFQAATSDHFLAVPAITDRKLQARTVAPDPVESMTGLEAYVFLLGS
jgi:hypothetical protein